MWSKAGATWAYSYSLDFVLAWLQTAEFLKKVTMYSFTRILELDLSMNNSGSVNFHHTKYISCNYWFTESKPQYIKKFYS